MKQTVVILTALILSLLVVTGMILTGSMKQTELIAQRDEILSRLYTEREELTLENLKAQRELETLNKTLEKLSQERDALSLQLNDAVLSSQEANDAVAMQEAQRAELEEALAAANLEIETLREALPSPAP